MKIYSCGLKSMMFTIAATQFNIVPLPSHSCRCMVSYLSFVTWLRFLGAKNRSHVTWLVLPRLIIMSI